jgi:hypothetical protein
MDAATAWEDYPANWSRCDPISFNATTDLQRRLEDPEGLFFSEDDDDINVRITDVNNGIHQAHALRRYSLLTVS